MSGKQGKKVVGKSVLAAEKIGKQKDAMKARIPNRKAFEAYAQFIALPTNEQQEAFGYVTDQAFARAHKLGKNTLTRWKTYDELWTLRDLTLQGMKRYTAQIMEAMRNKAIKEGDPAAAKLHLQFIEKWNPKVEVGASIELIGGEEDFG